MSKEKEITNDILGVSKDIRDLIEEVNKAAQEDNSVLIIGPTGTGKELVAQEIHKRSSRKGGHFVAVDCGAIATDLFESEMFGHKKGSFTDAIADKEGKIKLAEGGTLFLDEIGNLQPTHQGKLLRFLEDRKYYPLGYDKLPKKANVMVIAATNKDDLIGPSQEPFREDLYYRLNQYVINTILLNQRYEDVVFYANHFKKHPIDFITKALLYSYYYPGNVRELKNLINRDYDYVKKEIRRELGKKLGISSDTNLPPENDLFWKPYLDNLGSQRSDEIDSLRATFNFRKKYSAKLEKWVNFYEIVTLWFYTTLNKDDIAKIIGIRREKLSATTFDNTYELTLPKERDVKSIDIDDDFAGLPQKAMKLYPDFMEFFGLDLDE